MKFRSALPIPNYPFQIDYNDQLMLLGSCFSEHIAEFFSVNRFHTIANPFGILFNPLSISLSLNLLSKKTELSDHYFQFFDEKWISFAHHGKFSNPDKDKFITHIQNSLSVGQSALQQATILFITFGTSFYYYHKEKEIIVANCHKVPQSAFEKKMASVDEIVNSFNAFFEWKNANNSHLKVIFTVSPVRHLGDGFHENTLSKSILHLAVDALTKKWNCYYFPSYEIFEDDLRDYRFYDKDLCHPAQQGIDYVKEILSQSFFSETTLQQLKIVEKENKMLNHRRLSNDYA